MAAIEAVQQRKGHPIYGVRAGSIRTLIKQSRNTPDESLWVRRSGRGSRLAADVAANLLPSAPGQLWSAWKFLSTNKVELMSSQFEVQRAALEQMAVRLNSLQYPSPASRRSSAQTRANSLQELEAEYQELSDWLMDMDAMVTDSHQLMMSEEQRHHLFKSSHTELQMMEGRRSSLLSRLEFFRRSGNEPPRDLIQKVQELNQTWDQIKKLLSVHSGPAPAHLSSCPSLLSAAPAGPSGRCILSPLTESLLEQLESRIKELKSWLRDTELLIFNSCLRNNKEPEEQLQSFKSLCSDIRARRRGVSSVLKLCQKLLQQNQLSPTAEQEMGSTAELSPEAQQHQEALQLLSINLERRWEAIVMQALQWQNRLKRELGDEQVPGNFLEPGLVDLHQITSAQNVGTSGILTDDSWEWDETDMTISESNEEIKGPDLTHDLPAQNGSTFNANPQKTANSTNVYQVYNLHDVELYKQPQFPLANLKNKPGKHNLLTKSLSKDSSFSSVESLPDILGGIMNQKQDKWNGKVKKGIERGISVNSRRSESESGIDTGDTETANSEIQDFEDKVDDGKMNERWKLERNTEEDIESFSTDFERTQDFLGKKSYMQNRKPRKGEAVEILINGRGILTPADSDSDLEFESAKPFQELNFEQKSGLENRFSPVLSHGSSLESLLAMGVELFPMQRSASFDNTNRNVDTQNEETVEKQDLNLGKVVENSSEELSRRTLDLLQRLENIQSPIGGKMTRSVSDMALISMSPNRIPASPSLGGKISPLSGISSHLSPPSLVQESSTTTSMIELSGIDDLSQNSDDFKHKYFIPASAVNANYCKKHGNRLDEVDGASLSMVVNVSSACTDDEDDNSDLLSSSTLTEEELGVRDEMEDRFSATSSANEEEFDSPFGLDYMQKELKNWIQTPFSKSEIGLKDELQCGSNLHRNENVEKAFLNSSKLIGNKRNKNAEEENRRNATRSYISQFVDDVENGNVDQSCLKSKDADDELLREESSLFTKKSETLRDFYANTEEIAQDMSEFFSQSENGKQDGSKSSSYLVGQLKGELPCHNSSVQSPPLTTEDSTSHDALRKKTNGRKAITIQEKFKFMSLVQEQAKREVRERDFHNKRRHGAHCCSHHPGTFYSEEPKPQEENVHDFVMEIMDLTNTRRNRDEMETRAETVGAHIREKVLEHSHRSVQLRNGDFYSYLSLSSHDSDCGEVLQMLDHKNNSSSSNSPTPRLSSPSPEHFRKTTPEHSLTIQEREGKSDPNPIHALSPDIRDEETLFPACTEEVYLGPPLCYSLSAPKRQKRPQQNQDSGRPEEVLGESGLRFDSGNMRGKSPSYYSVLERREREEEEEEERWAHQTGAGDRELSIIPCVLSEGGVRGGTQRRFPGEPHPPGDPSLGDPAGPSPH
ncbi:A-kinase anchor protein 6-like [Periophthalmus magnuspinnatus]|uniref:A-kinase anchor protein 6-like n=1 Tax=Periophthalmus magnuspinnatus TaxID=409849 RepID=UPI00243637EB|nr:A-kinase anchor protein 6-like [Periophthalmus magnuspinnatus]